MAQKSENIVRRSMQYAYYKPKASTAFAAGDAVMKVEPNDGTINVITATREGEKNFVGIVDDDWSSNVAINEYGVGTTEYSSPSAARLKVHRKGIFDLAISDTSGYAGQTVYLSTVTSGSQIFTITQPDSGETCVPIGKLAKDFSGASANDCQEVEIDTLAGSFADDMAYYLNNHVIYGLYTDFDGQSAVSFCSGAVFVDGKFKWISARTNTCAILCNSAPYERIALYVVNSDLSTVRVYNPAFSGASSVGTASALADSAFWPTTSYLIFAAAYIDDLSYSLFANGVVNVRRSFKDIQYRRFISNA